MTALLIVEVVGLMLRFDGATLVNRGNGPVRILEWSPRIAAVGLCFVAVMVLLALNSGSFRDQSRRLLCAPPRRGWWVVLLAQIGMYGVFARITRVVFEGQVLSRHPGRWVALWFAVGGATLALWALILPPLGRWIHFLKGSWKSVLLAFAVSLSTWILGTWTSRLWVWLHESTFRAVGASLSWVVDPVVCIPADFVVGTPIFSVLINEQCAGYEGIGLIWGLLGSYLLLFRRELRFPQVLLLVPLGTMVIWFANVLRITMLVLVGTWGWPDVALGGFHSQAGWLAFIVVGLGLIVLSRRSGFFSRLKPDAEWEPESAARLNPTAAYLGPLVAGGLAVMITGALSDGRFDSWYPVRTLVVLAVLWRYRSAYPSLRWTWSWSALGIGVGVFAIWMVLEPAGSASSTATSIPDALANMSGLGAAAWLTARFLGSVVTVPVAEELAFRGYLMRRLIAADFTTVPLNTFTVASFVISSALFGALHERWLAGTLAGMLYSLAAYRRGRLGDPIVAHAVTNALIAATVLVTGAWSLWS